MVERRCDERQTCSEADDLSEVAAGTTRIKVLLVDDSHLMQKVMRRIYESDPMIEVTGIAGTGEEALQQLTRLRPDLVSLDLYMPIMDGITALKRIMLDQPTPTVMVTSSSSEDLALTYEAILRFGAVDFITKPAVQRGEIEMQAEQITARMHRAAQVNLAAAHVKRPPPGPVSERSDRGECRGLAVACGDTLAVMQMLTNLPADLPMAVIGVVDLPHPFVVAMVSYLSGCSAVEVKLAGDGAPLTAGVCYLASHTDALGLSNNPIEPALQLGGEPARDRLFRDAAGIFGERAVGLLLSGRGEEELCGLAAIRAAGGVAMVQLPESCVDPDRSRRAIERDLADRMVLPAHVSNDLAQVLILSRAGAADQDADINKGETSWPTKS
jgi:two-component system chemotaxis response regulator CheB